MTRTGDPGRLAHVFKSFVGAVAAVAAAMPLVVTTLSGALPIYAGLARTLPFFTSVLCVLAVGLLIAYRDEAGSILYVPVTGSDGLSVRGRSVAWLVPVFTAVCAVLALRSYVSTVDRSKDIVRAELMARHADVCLMAASALGQAGADDERLARAREYLGCVGADLSERRKIPEDEILGTKDRIPFLFELVIAYASIFVSAQTTLLLLALREYYRTTVER